MVQRIEALKRGAYAAIGDYDTAARVTVDASALDSTATSLLMIQPIGSMILFGEDPSALQLAGVLVVLGAVVFATRRVSGRDRATALGAAG